MIVVEGPDGAGKTTLIKEIQEVTGLEVAPRVVSKDAEAMVDLVKWTEDNVARGFQNLIFDRHRLISEPIYGPILREAPQPGFDDLHWFTHQLFAFYLLRPVVIYCLPPFERVWDNVRNDPTNRVVQDKATIRQIYGAYFNKAVTDHVLERMNIWVYDYTDQTMDIRPLLFHHIKEKTA